MTTKLTLGQDIVHSVNFITRRKIIDYLYNKLDLYKYSYNILNTIQKLKYLKYNEHYISPNFKGINYLLIMIYIDNQKYCILIDKKKLSYNKESIDLKNLNIYKLEIIIPEIMYDGTIIDGKLINNNIFLIHDCYFLMNENMLNIDMKSKLSQLNDVLNKNLKNSVGNFNFKLNKLYIYNELKELINNLSHLSYQSNGLIFFPKISGNNIIFLEKKIEKINIISKNDKNIENKSYNIINELKEYLKSREYSFENNTITNILFLEKIDIPDVYNVYNRDKQKIGIAGIPTLKISLMCNNIIKEKNKLFEFTCTYCNIFKKWIPLEFINS